MLVFLIPVMGSTLSVPADSSSSNTLDTPLALVLWLLSEPHELQREQDDNPPLRRLLRAPSRQVEPTLRAA